MKISALLLLAFSHHAFSQASVSTNIEISVHKTLAEITNLYKEIKNNEPLIIKTTITGSIIAIRAEQKLVISTVELAATVTKRFQNKDIITGSKIGDHLAIVSTTKYNAQYYIDISEIKPEDFVFDEVNYVMKILLSKPVLDKKMLSVDPSDIKSEWMTSGIAPYKDIEMVKITNKMKDQELRKEAIRQASSSTIVEAVENSGKIAIEQFIRKILMNNKFYKLMPWQRIEVVYK